VNSQPSVVYVLPDKMGGMLNIVANLLEYRRPDEFAYRAVLTHNHLHTDTRFARALPADAQTTVEYTLPIENLYAVMRRIARAIGTGTGVVVAGDLLDLATLSVHDTGRAVVLILHGDHEYYYDLAIKHAPIVHAYVAYSRRMYDRLLECLPDRRDSIFHIPYGIPIPDRARQPAAGPLRLIFAGRLEHEQKGILDLPEIDRVLAERGIDVSWTIVGAGPDEARVRAAWRQDRPVYWLGQCSNAEVRELLTHHDVFVLPTRHEGFPVALLEAMAAAVVPVVSDVRSGVPEIVTAGATGERLPAGDVRAFAEAIGALHCDRGRLEAMSAAARRAVADRFDIRQRVGDYQDLYARWRQLYRPLAAAGHLQYGSRLDRPWIPNAVVRLVRSTIRQHD
jgi:glycosyltransferase involved in cell wall biosynthesis